MTLGQKITNLRKARGMTQEELSESIGVTRQTISKWELDTSTPDLDYLCRLCDLFGVTADYLIRPEKEIVESAPSAIPLPPPAPSSTPSPVPSPAPPTAPPSIHSISATRFAGWVLFILGLVLSQIALIFTLFSRDTSVLWVTAAVLVIIGPELFLIRRRPWFVVMWTIWLIWTFLFTVVSGGLFLVFAMNIAFLITLLWIFYTAFCLGATVAVILIRIRTKRAKTS